MTLSIIRTLTCGAVLLTMAGNVLAQHGHGRGGGGSGHSHNHGGGGGHNFFGLSPAGLSYGYHDNNFGFQIGPFGGQGHQIVDHHRSYVPSYSPPANRYYETQPVYGAAPVMMGPSSNGTIITSSNGPAVTNARPIPQPAGNPSSPLSQPVSDPGLADNLVTNPAAKTFYDESRNAFGKGDYKMASKAALHAMLEDQKNGKLRLYVSQCQLANGDFEASAAHMYEAINLLEPDQWGLVVQNFRQFYKQNDYVSQVDKLVKFTQENPKAAYAFSLRGYHYLYLGYTEAAAQQFSKAMAIDPNEPLGKKLASNKGEAIEKSVLELVAPAPDSDGQ